MISGANEHDGKFLVALVDGVPPIRGRPGAPRSRPGAVVTDKAYSSRSNAALLVERRIRPMLPARGTDEDRGLGRIRWVVERTFAWLHQFRRLRVRYERRADIHEALLLLGCAIIGIRSL